MRTNFKMWKCLGILAGMAITSMLAVGQEFDLSPTFAGHAVALQVTNAEGNELEFAATGPAPANGGKRENALLDTPPIAGVSAHILYAVTLGAGSRNQSHASLAYFDATLGD